MYQIDTTVPVPASRRGRPASYPFARLDVNQSFAVPVADRDPDQLAQTVRNAARYFGQSAKKRTGQAHKFVVRKLVENGAPVVRCWRVE